MDKFQRVAIGLVGLTVGITLGCSDKPHAPLLGSSPAQNGGSGGEGGESSRATSGSDSGGSAGATSILTTTGSALVSVFAHKDGLLVVDESRVRKLSWKGTLIGTWKASRAILSADFDGKNLIVSDSAALTTLDLSLAPVIETQVLEACQFVVTISGNRVVCGPNVDWDRVFYTYDTLNGKLLATSKAMTYHGIPMRRVYGSDAFISVTLGTSPTDFYYHKVDSSTNAVVFYSDSPYHGDFGIDMRFGFLGDPATHLVTHEGLMLRIEGADCLAEPAASTCLTKDGNLGTLPGSSAAYMALSDAPKGTMYALVTSEAYPTGCYNPACQLQKIDVVTRTVIGTQVIQQPEDMTNFYLVQSYDGSGVVLVSSGRSIYYNSSSDALPYRLTYLRF